MNIYDIAKKAGVSIATISRVLNNSPKVSKKTREKVEAILYEYDYTPSALGRGLATNSTRTIGILTIDIRDLYYATVTHTIEQEFSKIGYNVILSNTGGNIFEKKRYLKIMLENKVDGVILVGSVFREKVDNQHIIDFARNMPVVMVNGCLQGDNIYSIVCDDGFATGSVVEYLCGKGHREIAYFQDADSYSGLAKLEGFKRSCSRLNLPFDEESIIQVQHGIMGGYEGAEVLLNSKRQFTAAVTGEDIVAVGILKKLEETGKRIPEDIAVTGFNNSILSLCTTPELSTVDNKMEAMGIGAVRILSDVFEGKNVPAKMVLTPELVIRKST